MKMNIDKIQYYRKNPSNFLEEICNIKLLPYQKYWLNKIWKTNKKYPLSPLYSSNSTLTTLITLIQKELKGELQ